jgi:Bcr/CflA subfamily drug resistance transporter
MVMIQSNLFKRTYIVLLAILAVLTSNMYAPGIPLIQASLHTNMHLIQMTISFYMLGLAIGMLIYGPLSDHFGRKPVLYVSLLIYIAGVSISIFSANIELFSFSRVIQAIGAAGALSLWQAISVDVYKEHANKMISVGYMAIGMIPALSPFIGSNIIHYFGWRSVFIVLIVYGVLLLGATFLFPAIQQHNSSSHSEHWLISSVKRYSLILKSRSFILLALATSVIYSQLYIYVAQVPSILHHLHYTTQQIGLFFIPISISFIVGGFFARLMLSSDKQTKKPLIIGLLAYLIGIILQLVFQFASAHYYGYMVITPFSIMTIGTGMMLPVIVGKAMQIFMHISGTSASFMGAMQNIAAFIFSALGALFSPLLFTGLTISLVCTVSIAVILICNAISIKG